MTKHVHLTYEEIRDVLTQDDDDVSDEAMALVDKVHDQIYTCRECYGRYYELQKYFQLFGEDFFVPQTASKKTEVAAILLKDYLEESGKALADFAGKIRASITPALGLGAELIPALAGARAIAGAGIIAGAMFKHPINKTNEIVINFEHEDKTVFEFELIKDAPVKMVAPNKQDGVFELNIWDIENETPVGKPYVFEPTPLAPENMVATTDKLKAGKYVAAIAMVDAVH